MSDELDKRLDELTGAIRALGDTRQEAQPAAKAADGGRYAAATDGSKSVADELSELARYRAEEAAAKAKADLDATVKAAVAEVMTSQTARSMASRVGDGPQARESIAALAVKAHPFLVETFGDAYRAGEAITAVAAYKGLTADGIDVDQINAGKAKLAELGMLWMGAADGPNVVGKATLGTTNATGGYVLPNNLVDTVDKPAVGVINWAQFIPFRDGVAVRAVDQPFRTGAPLRLQAQSVWGETKENRDEVYGSYSAPLTTFAAIYDVAKQYLRFSAGAAEQDVMDELTKAARLAEEFSVLAGPGTGTVGTGDATLGIYTSLAATPAWLGYAAAKTGSAASNTVIGSFASACAELVSKLAGRGRIPSVIVTDAVTYWTAVSQGTDEAGFFLSPTSANGGFTIDATGGLSYWGVPVRYSPNFNTFTGTTKAAIAIDGSAFRAYRGMEFRIDSSDVAGSRWDNNLVGFRGEMEMGFNAERGVHVGAAQLMTGVIA